MQLGPEVKLYAPNVAADHVMVYTCRCFFSALTLYTGTFSLNFFSQFPLERKKVRKIYSFPSFHSNRSGIVSKKAGGLKFIPGSRASLESRLQEWVISTLKVATTTWDGLHSYASLEPPTVVPSIKAR